MAERKLPKSSRKYIRREKARIRREVLDIKEQEKLIAELYSVRKSPEQNQDKKNKISSKKHKSF